MGKRMTIDVDDETAFKMFAESMETGDPLKKVAEKAVMNQFKDKKLPVFSGSSEDTSCGLGEAKQRTIDSDSEKPIDGEEKPLI